MISRCIGKKTLPATQDIREISIGQRCLQSMTPIASITNIHLQRATVDICICTRRRSIFVCSKNRLTWELPFRETKLI